MIIGIVVGVIVLMCLCGVGVVAILGSQLDDTTASSPQSSRPSVTFAAPNTIGSLKKSTDQAKADGLRGSLRSAGLTDPFAAAYEDGTTPTRTVLVWGGFGKAFGTDPQKELDSFFASAVKGLDGATIGSRADVSTGAVGGKMECAKIDGLGIMVTVCAWAGNNAVLGIMATGLDQTKGTAQAQAVLPNVVIKK
jgi:hypothetical protein